MLELIARWLEHLRLRQAAVASAVRYFEATTGTPAQRGDSRVIAERAGQFIVRVRCDDGIPMGRAWFAVGADGSVVCQLRFEQVQRYGEQILL